MNVEWKMCVCVRANKRGASINTQKKRTHTYFVMQDSMHVHLKMGWHQVTQTDNFR